MGVRGQDSSAFCMVQGLQGPCVSSHGCCPSRLRRPAVQLEGCCLACACLVGPYALPSLRHASACHGVRCSMSNKLLFGTMHAPVCSILLLATPSIKQYQGRTLCSSIPACLTPCVQVRLA